VGGVKDWKSQQKNSARFGEFFASRLRRGVVVALPGGRACLAIQELSLCVETFAQTGYSPFC